MNPMVQAALGSILRFCLAAGAGWLVDHGVWTQAEASTYVTAAVLGLLSLIWSLWQKYHGRIRLLTALASRRPMSEDELKATIAAGAPTPPVMSSPAMVPHAHV